MSTPQGGHAWSPLGNSWGGTRPTQTWVDEFTGEVAVTDFSEPPDWMLVGDVGDLTLAFADFGGAWVELTEIQGFWPVEGGSMILVGGLAIPVSCSPEEIVEKMKHVLLQRRGDPF